MLVGEPFTCQDPHLEVNGERVDVEDLDDALGQARAIDALYRSAASGAAVSL